MPLSDDERRRRNAERMKEKRRSAGVKPRGPAMSAEERARRNTEAKRIKRQSSRPQPSALVGLDETTVEIVSLLGGLPASVVGKVRDTIKGMVERHAEQSAPTAVAPLEKPKRKTATGANRLKITDTHLIYRGQQIPLDGAFCKAFPRKQWAAQIDAALDHGSLDKEKELSGHNALDMMKMASLVAKEYHDWFMIEIAMVEAGASTVSREELEAIKYRLGRITAAKAVALTQVIRGKRTEESVVSEFDAREAEIKAFRF